MARGALKVSSAALKRIWKGEDYRVFLSHKSDVKKKTGSLKKTLAIFGVSCFVAHEDIKPTRAWQDEIEVALASMDSLVALLTPGFHDSEWTDQEVGYAFARGVPILAVQLGTTPYGFIGKFQGLATTWDAAAVDIMRIIINRDRMFAAYVQALHGCSSWDEGNILAKALEGIQKLSEGQIDKLIDAYNETRELHGAFAFNGTRPTYYGPGLVAYLNKLSTRRFEYNSNLIEEI